MPPVDTVVVADTDEEKHNDAVGVIDKLDEAVDELEAALDVEADTDCDTECDGDPDELAESEGDRDAVALLEDEVERSKHVEIDDAPSMKL